MRLSTTNNYFISEGHPGCMNTRLKMKRILVTCTQQTNQRCRLKAAFQISGNSQRDTNHKGSEYSVEHGGFKEKQRLKESSGSVCDQDDVLSSRPTPGFIQLLSSPSSLLHPVCIFLFINLFLLSPPHVLNRVVVKTSTWKPGPVLCACVYTYLCVRVCVDQLKDVAQPCVPYQNAS